MELVFLHRERVRMPHGSQDFKPGDTVRIPDKVAYRLMELLPGSVRPVDTAPHLCPHVWIEFISPLFGQCTARIQNVTVEGCVITDHSVLKGEGEPIIIPASWIRDVSREQQAS